MTPVYEFAGWQSWQRAAEIRVNSGRGPDPFSRVEMAGSQGVPTSVPATTIPPRISTDVAAPLNAKTPR